MNKWSFSIAQEHCWGIHAQAHAVQHSDKWSGKTEQVAFTKLLQVIEKNVMLRILRNWKEKASHFIKPQKKIMVRLISVTLITV